MFLYTYESDVTYFWIFDDDMYVCRYAESVHVCTFMYEYKSVIVNTGTKYLLLFSINIY